MSIELKVKAKSLAEEARTIRREELKAKKRRDTTTLTTLWAHRTGPVRREARLTHLARGYMRGAPYSALEARVRPNNGLVTSDLRQIASMCTRYGTDATPEELDRWVWVARAAEAA